LYFSTGPSYLIYKKPVNITERPSGWGGILNFTSYTYNTKSSHLLGWGARVDFAYIPWRVVGFSLGGFYNYNREVPNGGLNLSIILGKLGEKNNKAE